MDSRILHVDMDAFFAAVETRENPELEGRPVVVGAEPRGGRGRGVVSTCNYEAREYGIHSAQPISEAYRRCPDAVFLPVRGSLYHEVGHAIREIFGRYTDLVEPISVDEAFLDVTASRKLFGPADEIARSIKEDIREEQALTASVGVATSKFVAKVASDLEKPDGLVVVEPGTEAGFLAPLELEHLWGAGPKAREKFHRIGVRTIGAAAELDLKTMISIFGDAQGARFYRLVRGQDDRSVEPETDRKSLGKESTFHEDVRDRDVVRRRLLALCEEVTRALRRKGLQGTTVTVKLRFEGFETTTHQRTLDRPVDTTERLWPIARELLGEADRTQKKVRLVGVTVSGFDDPGSGQLPLFGPDEAGEDARRTAEAIDAIAEKFGDDALTRASLLEDRKG